MTKHQKKCCNKTRKVVFDDETIHMCVKLRGTWRNSEIRTLKKHIDICVRDFLAPPKSTSEEKKEDEEKSQE